MCLVQSPVLCSSNPQQIAGERVQARTLSDLYSGALTWSASLAFCAFTTKNTSTTCWRETQSAMAEPGLLPCKCFAP